ncbi:MAG: hypothetical protein N3F65_04200 [Nitrososphaeria archaeon]|nr:hypothetical protein [Nitrososphaeria archaeon]MDW8021972.1 hypothetical protein [Nitrososphaerota archaeon]
MRLLAGICGSFPRPPALRRAFDELEAGRIGEKEFMDILENSTREVVGLQENAGMSVTTSGLLTWHDLLRPFAVKFSGIEPRRLLRFFDNNFYYRCPAIVGRVSWNGPVTMDEVRRVKRYTTRPVKAIIPGPYTFLKLSENLFYESEDLLVDDLIKALRSEADVLGEVADFLQVDEPSLVDPELGRADRMRGIDIVNELLSRVKIPGEKVIVATYFDLDPEKYSLLLELKAGLHVDLKSRVEAAREALMEYGFDGKLLSLGVIDSRSIFPEDPREIVYRLSPILDAASPETLIFSTSSWLDYIPFNEAVRKLDALGRVLAEAEVRFG